MRASRGLRPGVAESLEALAGLAVQHDNCAKAARLFGVASTLRDQMGLVRWPVQIAGYDSDVNDTRRALGEDAFVAVWAEGAGARAGAKQPSSFLPAGRRPWHHLE
jgi:hypothetical protein